LLFNVPQPYHNGGTPSGSYTIAQNVGAMTNKGIELTVTGGIIRKQDFKWDLTLNLTTVKNKITRMPKETPELVAAPFKRIEGKSIYEFFTREYYGVDPETGYTLYRGLQGSVDYDPKNAEHKLITHGDGRVDTLTTNENAARQVWTGKSALAPVYGSIVNNFTYKNFDFGFVLMYSIGGYRDDSQYRNLMSSGTDRGNNLHKDLLKAWQNPGDVSDIPANNLNRLNQNNAMSDRWLTKASYLSLSAVNVSYSFPDQWINQVGIKRARIFASAENLFFVSARKGFNPLGSISSSPNSQTYTQARTMTLGVNFGF